MIAGLIGDGDAGRVGKLIACADNEVFETYISATRLLFRWGLSRSFSSFFSDFFRMFDWPPILSLISKTTFTSCLAKDLRVVSSFR